LRCRLQTLYTLSTPLSLASLKVRHIILSFPLTGISDFLQVIITSHLFPAGTFSQPRLDALLASLNNDKERLVIDLSCRRKGDSWFVATDRWQTVTDFEITKGMEETSFALVFSGRDLAGDVGTIREKERRDGCAEEK